MKCKDNRKNIILGRAKMRAEGWPYSSGLKAYCVDNDLWRKIIKLSK